jgi:hypothetical protein
VEICPKLEDGNLSKNFPAKWCFVKSIPGDEALELLEFSLVVGELYVSVPLDPVPAKHA